MPWIQAVLLDVYETALTCDFSVHDVELPRAAGVPVDVWVSASRDLGQELMDGRKSLAEAFEHVIRSAGGSASSVYSAPPLPNASVDIQGQAPGSDCVAR